MESRLTRHVGGSTGDGAKANTVVFDASRGGNQRNRGVYDESYANEAMANAAAIDDFALDGSAGYGANANSTVFDVSPGDMASSQQSNGQQKLVHR